MNITTASIDLAKDVFTVYTQDAAGKTLERRDLRREALRTWMGRLPNGTVVGLEACSAAREMAALGLQAPLDRGILER